MTKLYKLFAATIMFLCSFISNGQAFNPSTLKQKHNQTFIVDQSLKKIKGPVTPYAAGCDTLLYTPGMDTIYGATSYSLGAGNGYLTGTNTFDDRQKGNYFDVSSSANNAYVTGVRFALAKANGPDLTKKVLFRVYDVGASDITLAGSSDSIPLSTLKPLVGGFVDYKFPTAIPLTSKVFIISLDFSTLSWAGHDSLAIFSSAINSVVVPDSAVEQESDSSWAFMSSVWDGLDNGMFVYLFPYVSNNLECTLPVKLFSFSVNRFGTTNKLSWTTVSETATRGFEIERSSDGVNFFMIDFVNSKAVGGNSSGKIDYVYTDKNPLAKNNYYRIKQVDLNSKAAYSKTLLLVRDQLNNQGIVLTYPNPAKNVLNLVVDLPTGQSNNLSILDMAGKTLIQKQVQGSNSNINVTINISKLQRGTYFVKLAGDGKSVKFVKE
jgi:hypothetical protein